MIDSAHKYGCEATLRGRAVSMLVLYQGDPSSNPRDGQMLKAYRSAKYGCCILSKMWSSSEVPFEVAEVVQNPTRWRSEVIPHSAIYGIEMLETAFSAVA